MTCVGFFPEKLFRVLLRPYKQLKSSEYFTELKNYAFILSFVTWFSSTFMSCTDLGHQNNQIYPLKISTFFS